MKIIQLVTQMEAGGAQKVASLLTEGLRDRGHDAQLWFLYKKRQAYSESTYVRSLFPQRPSHLEFAELAIQLWRELDKQKPDAVITHTHSANSFGSPIAAAAHVPVRIAVHHNPVDSYSWQMRAADGLAFLTGCYSSMVTVSGGVTHSFSRHSPAYQQRLHRIYNGIGETSPGVAIDVRARYGIPTKARLLVNVGRLARQKNQSLLLKLLQRMPDCVLMLVGEGELHRELFAEAMVLGVAERVRFTGELKSGYVDAILQQADLFLLPSMYESFCLAAVEAMRCGLPVIATDLPCLREVLGESQLFFKPNDILDLVRKTEYVLEHRQHREGMAAAGQAHAERYTVARMVGEYESLLAEAALYAHPRKSAPNNLRRIDALRGVPRVHHHL